MNIVPRLLKDVCCSNYKAVFFKPASPFNVTPSKTLSVTVAHFSFLFLYNMQLTPVLKKEPLLVCNEGLWKGHGNMLSLTLMSIKGCLNINSDVKP